MQDELSNFKGLLISLSRVQKVKMQHQGAEGETAGYSAHGPLGRTPLGSGRSSVRILTRLLPTGGPLCSRIERGSRTQFEEKSDD